MNNSIYEKIQAECDRQDEKWGIRNNHPLEWLTILYEETGEVAMEVNDAGHDVANLDMDKYETELIQCGAVITQMLKNIDQYKIFKKAVEEEKAMEALGINDHLEKVTEPEVTKLEDEFEKLPVNNNFTIIPKCSYIVVGKAAGQRNNYTKVNILEITDVTILYTREEHDYKHRQEITSFNTEFKIVEQV